MGFKTAAFLGGAAQGLNVLGQGMLRQVERDAEQGIWEKRQALLSEIQRENARNLRSDEFAFRNDPTNVAAEVGTATVKAEAATKSEIARLRALGPEQTAQDKARLEALMGPEAKRAGMLAGAAASAQQSVRDKADAKVADKNPLLEKFKDYEQATGTPLPAAVKKQLADAYLGLGKIEDGTGKKALEAVLKSYENQTIKADEVGAELGRVMRSLSSPDGAGPAAGTEVNGYVFQGGNPNDKANWKPKDAAAAPTATPGARKQTSAPIDQIAAMNDRTLRQIASIQGHTSQAAAQAELKRRRDAALRQQGEDESAASSGFSGA